ncbi:MAG TPA: hypothetical protein VF472_22325 [Burkholderiaceae bacterium]
MQSEYSAPGLEILQHKVPVLEIAKQAEIAQEAAQQQQLALCRIFRPGYQARQPPIDHGRGQQDQYIGRVPGSVKEIAGDQQQNFLGAPARQQPKQSIDDDEKKGKAVRIKKHSAGRWVIGESIEWTPPAQKQKRRLCSCVFVGTYQLTPSAPASAKCRSPYQD